MELLESQNPEKRKLIETSERHKRALEKEFTEISAKTERALTNALIIGGSLAVTYFLVTQFTKSKSAKKKVRSKASHVAVEEDEDEVEEVGKLALMGPSLISQIGTKVINQATMILLDMARQKLNEYLHTRNDKNENS